ncbi:MAG TPA: zf-HC2 domain-containing protein [Thermoanaerobaculia bacterium]|nr:zf-HC2 domain-containing protein [Thermoanaerobaculia bacterium]
MPGELKTELKAVLEDFLAGARQDLASHPEPEELLAYRAGELPAPERARVEDHVVACPHCLELLLDLGRLSDPGFVGEHGITAAEKAAGWQAVQARLAPETAPHEAPRRRRAVFFASPRPAWALAAALLVAVVGLSLRTRQLERSVEDLSRPQVNAPVVDLFPASELRGGEGEAAVVELAPASRFFTLILSPKGSSDYAGYRLEILDSGGRAVWSAEGLEKDRHGSFTLILARSFLAPGDYRLRLYGLEGDAGTLIEELRVRIVLGT